MSKRVGAAALGLTAPRYWIGRPGLWGCCFGGPWRRPSRREETEELKDYIAELKEALQDAEERLKDLEK